MMSADFWMPLYVGKYLKDTLHLSTLQHGAYCLLLMHYWVSGPLPDDDAQLASIAKLDRRTWNSMRLILRPFFTSKDGKLFQKRAEIERAKAETLTADRSEAGKAGAKARWQTHRQPDDDPNGGGIANASQTHSKSNDKRYAHLPNTKYQEKNPPYIPPVGGERGAKRFRNGFLQVIAEEGMPSQQDDQPNPVVAFQLKYGNKSNG